MAMSGGKDDGSPMMEMNTTPLIDVMLVLLIMFIITIPVATHAVNIDLPNPSAPPPDERPGEGLPADQLRHRVALLVPLTGPNADVGQSIANATTMALLDTNAQSLRITTYDTSAGPAAAATKAVQDGNKLILGPLVGDEVPTVATIARAAKVPMISYATDLGVNARDVFAMGTAPGNSLERTVAFAKEIGRAHV